ncbi:M56 family metallopeptidase [Lutispora saccharofermentans]|uniref:DUF4829 domain-containing protein n=1 Tax=Lutispora saccharofermentans TaxID=3024236 RepID=A0ABT1NGL2_9FIRM|nr:M56 family metallopeptidase [Lutispora saccharofermentans]MCQ1530405.1 DUF4829 domain-containing protein [Lutispora saccharofermentans]
MNETIKLILSLSLSGSILAVSVFAFKPFIKHKLSKSVQYYIWVVVLLRLVLPFSFEGSIMNSVFYGETASLGADVQKNLALPISGTGKDLDSSTSAIVRGKAANGIYDSDIDHSRYISQLFSKYIFGIWLFGAIAVFAANIAGYARFSKHLKKANKPADDAQNKMLAALLDGCSGVGLVRNRFAATPMLIGLIRPSIIIPDIDFDENQLKNILLHEISHLKRHDIAVKWLAMIASSIHWFNPIIYFIKKEINHSCELACDESVIKNLSPAEKQAYGDTLISIVAEHRYPYGALQATMSEEKNNLKERLLAIMRYNEKPKFIIALSGILLGVVIFSAIYLGAGVGKDILPDADFNNGGDEIKAAAGGYDLNEIIKHKTPYVGDASKVYAIISLLPVPDDYFKQQYMSMKTSGRPYGLTIYYEAASDAEYEGEWPIVAPDTVIEMNSRFNALVAFSMIGNLEEVSFAFRNSPSHGSLDESKYNTVFTFPRDAFEEKYGDISALGENLDLLQDILAVKKSAFSDAEVSEARGVVEEYFRAIAAKDDKAILKTLTPSYNHPNVVLYGEEIRTLLSIDYDSDDPMRESYVKHGRGKSNGTKLENVIVFKVNFNVKYPEEVSGSFNEGEYKNWSMILIRDGKTSSWLIDDQGY